MKNAKRFPLYFSLVFTAVVIFAFMTSSFEPVERIWHDRAFVQAWDKLPTGDPRLILLAIDDETGQKHGFPLPRSVHAQAVEKLRELGVKAIVFDVLFFEKREGDAELAAATKRHGGVVHLFAIEKDGENAAGDHISTQLPIKPFADAAKILGCPIISQHLDADGHIRDFSLFNGEVADPLPRGRPMKTASLAVAGLTVLTGKPLTAFDDEFGGDKPLVRVLNYRQPSLWLRHEKDDEKSLKLSREELASRGVKFIDSPYRTISMLDLLAGRLTEGQKAALKGSLVMIGSTATGYYDHYPTPFTTHAPGAEYHLNVIDNVLHGDYLHRADILLVLILLLVAAWLPFFFVSYLPTAGGALATAGTVFALFFASSRMMASGTLLYPVGPAIVIAVAFLALTVHRVLTEGAEKQLIKAKFGQFVSPEIVEELANDPEKAKLGAQKREMTVLFLDIAHFTTISEKMGPEALMAFLNKYLSALSEVMLDRRGTIDKYIGDCIMAFWNAPLENKNHATDAVLSALHCQKAIDELNKDLDPGMPEIPAIRIGINTGQMNVGFTGTERKLAYTVIGDEVNLASRLEGANKFFGSRIIVSGATYEEAKSAIEARYLGKARVVGKDSPVPVYEPLAEKGKLSPEWTKALPVWEKGIKAFYDKKYDDALAAFDEFTKLMPGDGPGELYHGQSRDYAALPPDDWDQVFKLTAK